MAAIKIAVFGSSAVGKSALAIYFTRKNFVEDYLPTQEDVYDKEHFIDEKLYKFLVRDTAGQESFQGIKPQFIQDNDAFILVYDLNRIESLPDIEEVYKEIQSVKKSDVIPIVIAGNKSDLLGPKDDSWKNGQEYAERIQAKFFKTSAKDGSNVIAAFEEAGRLLIKTNPEKYNPNVKTEGSDKKSKTKDSKCPLF